MAGRLGEGHGQRDGREYLRETAAPSGYNLLTDDIRLVLNATIAKNSDGEQRITALTLDAYKGTTDSKYISEAITGDVATGLASLDVMNGQGATLPQTGATGTTIMLLVGSVLVVGAAVLMVTRKKMSAYKD